MKKLYNGVFPIAPTPFDDQGSIDLESQKRVLDCMIDQGVDGVCILANYSEQFLLSDEERARLLTVCMEHVAGRVPVIVTCSHFSTQIAADRARSAAEHGADMIMMMPPYHGALLKAGPKGIIEHFETVAAASNVKIMVQDAPLSGVDLPIELLVDLATNVPGVSYFKIETPQTADKLRALIEAGGDAIIGPFDGEESITLMADLNAGAKGTMPSALVPDLIKPVLTKYSDNNLKEAEAAYAKILPIINFENRQCGLRACKAIMKEGGVIASEYVRHPLPPLAPETRAQLLELARPLNPVALTWGH
jgi:dihydrodipicolinate synthase/N-acetylneuraminate lyase|tara:strand:+ start:1487 stop:2404 length:918 start_codon:yes stop_codon:yes gene_type:complete